MLPDIDRCYGSLTSMLKKFDAYARKDCFKGKTKEEFLAWKEEIRKLLTNLLGIHKMEFCDLNPVMEDVTEIAIEVEPDTAAEPVSKSTAEHRAEKSSSIKREHIRIQVEPDVWMPMYILIPEGADSNTRVFLCPPGHNGGGKYAVAGRKEYSAVNEKIKQYHYDYGYELAKLGYVAVCPDCRGFGERREDIADTKDELAALKGDCYWLAHMGEPLGIPVAGMLTWDLMRAIDYVKQRGDWKDKKISCLGFSGGGMQVLWLAALDDRVGLAIISGYMYGYRDALMTLNRNCSCNYVPHLWEHLDMGDIGSLIAPRPLLIQSCRDDMLNGPRGIINAIEQVDIIRKAYKLMGASEMVIHEICEGTHQWHGEKLKDNLAYLSKM
ncbi:dienelactone hydrolase family protein [Anaerobium acetethylicum]|uniref:Abhydrolase family protein n=1 Tax=Anaerobium acetethylicum TaxID=1619234 RepID=A0A1D3TX78_9FIRM|nr:alpha/beta hydrolase family protein [Anaerobium acetethylicum]SCP98895.1 Abhydrolase family protein [Anaerobium acetethylicum]